MPNTCTRPIISHPIPFHSTQRHPTPAHPNPSHPVPSSTLLIMQDIVAQLMTANKNLSANSSSPQSPSNTAAVAAGMSVTAGMPGNDARSVGGGGGGGGGGPRAARARPGAGRAHPNSNQNPPAPPSAGGRGRGNNNASQRGGVGGRGGGGGGGGGGGQGGSGGNGERAGQDSQGSAAPTAAMAGVAIGPGGAARSVQKPAADTVRKRELKTRKTRTHVVVDKSVDDSVGKRSCKVGSKPFTNCATACTERCSSWCILLYFQVFALVPSDLSPNRGCSPGGVISRNAPGVTCDTGRFPSKIMSTRRYFDLPVFIITLV